MDLGLREAFVSDDELRGFNPDPGDKETFAMPTLASPRRVLMTLTATCSAVLLGLGAGCSSQPSDVTWQNNGTPQHAHPNQDWWNYQYVYYPRAQVYFEPYSRVYSWYDGLQWQDARELPANISLHGEHPYVVKNKSELPYYQHGTIVQEFRPHNEAIAGSMDLEWSEGDSQRYASHPSHSDN